MKDKNKTEFDIEKYKDKGLSGLANLGNTCFINSCVQILSHTYEFTDFLEKGTYKKTLQNKPESVLLVEFDDLRKMLWSNNVIISPGKFIKTIQKVAELKDRDIFTGYSQNDSQEFLLFLMDCFHTAIAGKSILSSVENQRMKQIKLQPFVFKESKKCIPKNIPKYGIFSMQFTFPKLFLTRAWFSIEPQNPSL